MRILCKGEFSLLSPILDPSAYAAFLKSSGVEIVLSPRNSSREHNPTKIH